MVAVSAAAAVPADTAARLGGPALTCNGAEVAGTQDGIPAYSNRFRGSWPGVKKDAGYVPGPYADETPLFTITAQNAAQYAARLSAGELAMLKRYPQTFRMNVYPSHRDFGELDRTCKLARQNALTAKLVDDGRGVSGKAGAVPFPIPNNGLEAIWNVANAGRVWTEDAICDIADVYAGGQVAWGRQHYRTLALNNDPHADRSYRDRIAAHFYVKYLLPERDRGFVAVGYQPNDYADDATRSWQYLPGTRRMRQAPEVGFDYPVPPAGFRTADDDYGFNGSPERYDWKLVGKRELYVPYDNFRINDPSIKYADLIGKHSVNPDDMRYELHRVWVIEGTLKPGLRHIYSKRVIYADEDTWLAVLADNDDARGQLWRVAMITYHYSQQAQAWHRGVSLYHDLTAGTYEAGYLVNESRQWWALNTRMSPIEFTPEAAVRSGH
ncbi:DUF1329 domain-containing protein [Solimonas sp. C16B3]|uniref:DUF1329 domain-containing protein n=2 Tax=Solimonas marina TaxID=2714601 RepID=A0A969W6P9_9GAMM|nr:DUF1329 domain-containing protein [Solimonas marina]